MNSPARVVILAEDMRHARFVRAYLRSRHPKLGPRDVFEAPMANGSCAGEQWVREHYAEQILAHLIRRTRKPNEGRSEKWLIVVIDADKKTVQERLNELRKQVTESGDERVRKCRVEENNVARLVPKWSIETWILHLQGEAVGEDVPYKRQPHPWDASISSAAAELNEWIRRGNDIPYRCIPSLKLGISELRRLTA